MVPAKNPDGDRIQIHLRPLLAVAPLYGLGFHGTYAIGGQLNILPSQPANWIVYGLSIPGFAVRLFSVYALLAFGSKKPPALGFNCDQ